MVQGEEKEGAWVVAMVAKRKGRLLNSKEGSESGYRAL